MLDITKFWDLKLKEQVTTLANYEHVLCFLKDQFID